MITRLGVSVFFALWMQLALKFCLDVDISETLAFFPIYMIYLAIGHMIVLRVHQPNYRLLLLLGGVFGCLIEWGTQGYSYMRYDDFTPIANFAYHAVYPVMGVIIMDKIPYDSLIHRLRTIFVLATFSVPLGYFVSAPNLQEAWFTWAIVAPYFICFTLILAARPLIKRLHA